MRIAVIAADGRSGRAFVETALAAGHTVRAGIRGSSPFTPQPELEFIQCDATNEAQVDELLQASDAVVSLIGHIRGSNRNVQTIATHTVLAVMQKRGIHRIVSLTGTGVRIPKDKYGIIDILANLFIAKIDPARIQDGIAHVKVLQESDADFTIVRVLKLTGGKERPFNLSDHGPAKYLTSRTEVAKAIVECLEDNRYIRAYPVISK